MVWVGLILSVEGIDRKKTDFLEEGILPLAHLQTQTATSLWVSSLPPTLQILDLPSAHNCGSQFLTMNLSPGLVFMFDLRVHLLLVLFLWRTLSLSYTHTHTHWKTDNPIRKTSLKQERIIKSYKVNMEIFPWWLLLITHIKQLWFDGLTLEGGNKTPTAARRWGVGWTTSPQESRGVQLRLRTELGANHQHHPENLKAWAWCKGAPE